MDFTWQPHTLIKKDQWKKAAPLSFDLSIYTFFEVKRHLKMVPRVKQLNRETRTIGFNMFSSSCCTFAPVNVFLKKTLTIQT